MPLHLHYTTISIEMKKKEEENDVYVPRRIHSFEEKCVIHTRTAHTHLLCQFNSNKPFASHCGRLGRDDVPSDIDKGIAHLS